jgi:hypothetical protein
MDLSSSASLTFAWAATGAALEGVIDGAAEGVAADVEYATSGGCSTDTRRCRSGRQGIGLLGKGAALGIAIEREQGFQFGQETLFAGALHAVRIADTNGHFVGELALAEFAEQLRRIIEFDAFEQYVLIQLGQFRRIGTHRFGEAADVFAFPVVVAAIGKGGKKADAQDGMFRCHGCFSRR